MAAMSPLVSPGSTVISGSVISFFICPVSFSVLALHASSSIVLFLWSSFFYVLITCGYYWVFYRKGHCTHGVVKHCSLSCPCLKCIRAKVKITRCVSVCVCVYSHLNRHRHRIDYLIQRVMRQTIHRQKKPFMCSNDALKCMETNYPSATEWQL